MTNLPADSQDSGLIKHRLMLLLVAHRGELYGCRETGTRVTSSSSWDNDGLMVGDSEFADVRPEFWRQIEEPVRLTSLAPCFDLSLSCSGVGTRLEFVLVLHQ